MLELIILLMIKHAVADLYIQTVRPPCDKTDYLSKGLHWHAFDHGILTLLVLIHFVEWDMAIALAVADYFIHLHIDFFKSTICKRINISRQDTTYWKIQTFDQIAHYLTYYGIVYYISNLY